MFYKDVYIQRRQALKSLLNTGIGLFLGNLDSPMNYADNIFHFRQDSSFLYFFGLDEPGLAAIIDFETGEEIIFGDDITMEDIIWMGTQSKLADKASLVGVIKINASVKLFDTVKKARASKREVHYLPPYRAENKIMLANLFEMHPNEVSNHTSEPLIKGIIKLRSVKERCEIVEIEKACAIGYEMHHTAMQMAIEGASEQEIAGVVEGIPLKHGGHYSFPVILTQNGQTLHNHKHNGILTKGRLMLCDAGAESPLHYASDFTRTTPVNGIFTQQQQDIYRLVLDANNATTAAAKPGVTYQSIHLMAAKIIAEGLKNLGLMKGNVDDAVAAGAHALFFPHGLGHMMGLDVHDMEDLGQTYVGYDDFTRPINQFGTAYLRMGRTLEPGFVITNEPGIYFIPPLIEKWSSEKLHVDFINYDKLNSYINFGGIRLEDDLLITDTACRILGKRIPITPDEIQKVVGE